MNLRLLEIDTVKQEEGVELPFGDAKVTLRSRDSEKFKAVLRDKFKPYESQITLGILPEETQQKLTFEAVAEGLIIGWSGFKMGKDDFPPTEENKVLAYTKFIPFRRWVDENVTSIDNFRAKLEGEETKN